MKENINHLLQNGRTQLALEEISNVFAENSKLLDSDLGLKYLLSEFTLLKGQFKNQNRAINSGLISIDDPAINRISKAVIQFVDELPEKFWRIGGISQRDYRIEAEINKVLESTKIKSNLIETFKVSKPTFEELDSIYSEIRELESDEALEAEVTQNYLYSRSSSIDISSNCAHFLIAKHLYKCLKLKNSSDFSMKQFIFPIHKHLSFMLRNSDSKTVFESVLKEWFDNRMNNSVLRNFCAFELGLIKSSISLESLFTALKTPNEDYYVRVYSGMALAMIKNENSLDDLIRVYVEKDLKIKSIIANSINYIYYY